MAGVSPAMVSRVLNHNYGSPETRAKVLKAARELNYRPNAAARAIVTRRSYLLGAVTPRLETQWIGDVVTSMQAHAERLGYEMMIVHGKTDPESEDKVLNMLVERRVEGIALLTANRNCDHYERFQAAHRTPLIFLDHAPAGSPPGSLVSVDHVEAGRLAADYLLERGFRRIAAIGQNHHCDRLRLSGFLDAHRQHGVEAFEPGTALLRPREAIADRVASLLPHKPDALVTMNMHYTKAVLAALNDLAVSIPGDLALLCIGNESWYDVYRPPLTAVAQPIDEIGRVAVERLVAMAAGGVRESSDALLAPFVVPRRSCGEVREASQSTA